MNEVGKDEYLCISFNNYGLVPDIAAKISDECQAEENNSEEDFEFSLASENSDKSIAKFIYDTPTKFQQPIFPLFNRDLLLSDSDLNDIDKSTPLKKLYLEKNKSLEETIPATSYCMRKSKISEPSPRKWNKSKLTGFGPRIRDLLWRSNSGGKEKDNFLFLTRKAKSKNSNEVWKTDGKLLKETKNSRGEKGLPAAESTHRIFCYLYG